MKTIKQTYQINASVADVWKALVDPKVIERWGRGPASMSEKAGATFSLWGGDIHGKNIQVVSNKKLVQEWSSGDWKKPSKVTIVLIKKGNGTELDLLHEDVPDEEQKDIADGWGTYYLGPMKKLVEET